MRKNANKKKTVQFTEEELKFIESVDAAQQKTIENEKRILNEIIKKAKKMGDLETVSIAELRLKEIELEQEQKITEEKEKQNK